MRPGPELGSAAARYFCVTNLCHPEIAALSILLSITSRIDTSYENNPGYLFDSRRS